jgi:hypothetical protein
MPSPFALDAIIFVCSERFVLRRVGFKTLR